MRQNYEICEIFGFWREIQNITRTRLEYIAIHTLLEYFPAKNIGPAGGKYILYCILYVCERHSQDSGVGSK